MSNNVQISVALESARLGMFRSLGILEAISNLNEDAGLTALIDAGKHVLGTTMEDAEIVLDAISSGDAK